VERDWFRPALAWVFGLWALLVSIFLTRVFAFVESQFGAVFGLAVDLLLLISLRYAAEQERRVEQPGAPGEPVAAAAKPVPAG